MKRKKGKGKGSLRSSESNKPGIYVRRLDLVIICQVEWEYENKTLTERQKSAENLAWNILENRIEILGVPKINAEHSTSEAKVNTKKHAGDFSKFVASSCLL